MKRITSSPAIIIPTLNEEKNIRSVISDVISVLGDPFLLVVDAHSVDKTVDLAKDLGANVLLQEGKGKGAGLRQAFEYKGIERDMVVIFDADRSMDPKEIPRYVEALEAGADVAKGSRFLPGASSEDISLARKFGNGLLVLLVNLLWSVKYTDLCYGFMAFKKEALEKLSPTLSSTHFEIETEICIKAKKLGLKVVEVPSFEARRGFGKSNLNTFRDGFRILVKIIRELLVK